MASSVKVHDYLPVDLQRHGFWAPDPPVRESWDPLRVGVATHDYGTARDFVQAQRSPRIDRESLDHARLELRIELFEIDERDGGVASRRRTQSVIEIQLVAAAASVTIRLLGGDDEQNIGNEIFILILGSYSAHCK